MIPYRLLAIEDNKSIADMICRVAAEVGLDACSANGTTATDMYDSFHPQVIVLDILMPEMDGLEFLQILNKKSSKSHIVILSGSGKSYRAIAENLGISNNLIMEANIAKPFRINEVRTVLKRIKESLNDEINWKKHNA
jgi:two-component system OmpR family response regulator